MADHAVERLGGKTLLQYADTPYMDMLAKKGRTGRRITVPDGYSPGSEVANTPAAVTPAPAPYPCISIGYSL